MFPPTYEVRGQLGSQFQIRRKTSFKSLQLSRRFLLVQHLPSVLLPCCWWAWSRHFLIHYSVGPYEIPDIWLSDFLRLQFPMSQFNSSCCLSLPKTTNNGSEEGGEMVCSVWRTMSPTGPAAQDFSPQCLHVLVSTYNECNLNILCPSQSETDILPWPTELLVIDISAYVNNFLMTVCLQTIPSIFD